MLSIKPIKAFSDNYIWLVSTNEGSIVVDPGEADQVLNLCESNDIDLKGILITHPPSQAVAAGNNKFCPAAAGSRWGWSEECFVILRCERSYQNSDLLKNAYRR